MSGPSFSYNTLDKASRSIRLLILSPIPHPEDNRIQCSLVTKSLNSSPQYEALSYVWGPVDELNLRIRLDNCLFPVRRNLLLALRALRGVTERILWVDALCINQEDTEERGIQVQIMGSIYAGAQCVLSWLGTPDETELENKAVDVIGTAPRDMAVEAFTFVEDASRKAPYIANFRQNRYFQKTPVFKDTHNGYLSPWERDVFDCNALCWNQLGDICEIGYWSRMWILQECSLARRLQLIYGTRSIKWETFQIFCRAVCHFGHQFLQISATGPMDDHDRFIASEPWKRFETIAPTFPQVDRTLKTLVELSLNLSCGDKRDKIYGLLGIASDVREGLIPVDYSRPLSHLYGDIMEFQIQRTGDNWDQNSIIMITQFSHLLQKTLLSQGFTNPFESFRARQSLADRRLRIRILGEPIGKVEAASNEPNALVPRVPIDEIYQYRSSGSNAASWKTSMRSLFLDAWGRFPIMECESVSSPRVMRLTTFTAKCLGGKWAVGISREGIEARDILWRIKGGSGNKADSFAVLRAYPNNKVILARASLAKDLQELKASDYTIQNLPLARPLGCDPWKSQEQDNKPIMRLEDLTVGLDVLQVLTCPWKYDGWKESRYH